MYSSTLIIREKKDGSSKAINEVSCNKAPDPCHRESHSLAR